MNTTLFLALLALAPGGDAVGPLQAPTPVADLGEQKTGPTHSHTFELKHTGATGTVLITGVETPCGCTKAELQAKVLKPGEATKLTVAINTLTQREGANSWPITLRYRADDLSKPEETLELKLTAKLVREISVSPPLLAVTTSGAVTHTLKVEDRRATPLTVTKVTCTNPAFTATVAASKKADGVTVQEITLTVKEELAAGSHDDTVTLVTDDATCPTLSVSVKVHKRGANDAVASPSSPTVRFTKGQAEASTLVQIRHDGKPVSISKVEADNAGITVKHSEGSGPVQTVRVVVSAAKAGASGQATVTVTLAEPAGGKVVLPVSWYEP